MGSARDPDLHDRRTVEIVYVLVTSVLVVAAPVVLVLGYQRLVGVPLAGSHPRAATAALGLLVLVVTIRAVRALRAFETRSRHQTAAQATDGFS